MQSSGEYRNTFKFIENPLNSIKQITKIDVNTNYDLIYDGVLYFNNSPVVIPNSETVVTKNVKKKSKKIGAKLFDINTSDYKKLTSNKRVEIIQLFDKLDEKILKKFNGIHRNYLMKEVAYKTNVRLMTVVIKQNELIINFDKSAKDYDTKNLLKEIEEIKKYFNPNEKNFLLKDKEDLILEENILRLGKLLYEKRFNNTNRIKFNSIKEQEIKDLTKNIKKYIFSKKNVEFQNEYKNFKKCLSEINKYFEKISKDNNVKNKKTDTTLIDSKQEYLDNYVFNAIVNHANYYYKSKKKNHINEDKIIEEIILNDYLKNKKKSRFNILKNYLSNSNPKSKFKNRYQVENAIRKINDEMEDAQKEFSKLFQNNEKDYN